jgi:hypothetical protein
MRAKPNARKLKDKRLRSKESRCFTVAGLFAGLGK